MCTVESGGYRQALFFYSFSSSVNNRILAGIGERVTRPVVSGGYHATESNNGQLTVKSRRLELDGLSSFLQVEKSKNRFMLEYCDKPDAKPGTYFLLVLISLMVWLPMLLVWYLVGLSTGPGIYPRSS